MQIRKRGTVRLISSFVVLGWMSMAASSMPAQTPVLSSAIPRDVGDLQARLVSDSMQDNLDNLSWQTFVALNWPVRKQPGARAANAEKVIGQAPTEPRVWELFTDPVTFLNPELTTPSANKVKSLYLDSKRVQRVQDPADDSQAAIHKRLLDQQGNFVVYEIRINDVEAGDLTSAGLVSEEDMVAFARQNIQGNPPTAYFHFSPGYLPQDGGRGGSVGAIEIKSAWRIFTDQTPAAVKDRYHCRQAVINVPETSTSLALPGLLIPPVTGEKVTIGLVGLHIAHKTVTHPNWLWATFEHIDNYEIDPTSNPPADLKPSFNDGTAFDDDTWNMLPNDDNPVWKQNVPPYAGADAKKPNVFRCANEVALPDKVNTVWQKALGKTVWRHYRLNGTQWFDPNGQLWPQKDGVSIVRNSTLETYLVTWADRVTTGKLGEPKDRPLSAKSIDSLVYPNKSDGTRDVDRDSNAVKNYLIPAAIEPLSKPSGKPQQTWSSCVYCHQAARWQPKKSANLPEGTSVYTDYSFVLKSFLQDVQPQEE